MIARLEEVSEDARDEMNNIQKRLCDVIKLAFEHYDTVWLVDNEDAVELT